MRIHAPFVSDNEIEKINNFLRSQAGPDYIDEILNFADEKEIGENKNQGEKDDSYNQAVDIIEQRKSIYFFFTEKTSNWL